MRPKTPRFQDFRRGGGGARRVASAAETGWHRGADQAAAICQISTIAGDTAYTAQPETERNPSRHSSSLLGSEEEMLGAAEKRSGSANMALKSYSCEYGRRFLASDNEDVSKCLTCRIIDDLKAGSFSRPQQSDFRRKWPADRHRQPRGPACGLLR